MLVKEVNTPFEAITNLREKYAVKKVREDFNSLDTEWNNYRATDVSTNPFLIFKTLEDQSR